MARGRPRQKSEYGLQLAEKQKIRNDYGLRERQFRGYFKKGKEPGNIYALLEARLDNAVYRAGFTPTRAAARQMVSHGHILVNKRKVTIPSYRIKIKDVILVRSLSNKKGMFADYKLRMKKFESPSWIKLDKNKMEAQIKATPDIKEQTQPFNFQTVIEFYSR